MVRCAVVASVGVVVAIPFIASVVQSALTISMHDYGTVDQLHLAGETESTISHDHCRAQNITYKSTSTRKMEAKFILCCATATIAKMKKPVPVHVDQQRSFAGRAFNVASCSHIRDLIVCNTMLTSGVSL